jgi:DNA-binding protein Fis
VKSHAARILGISRPTLDKKMADFKIDIWSKE